MYGTNEATVCLTGILVALTAAVIHYHLKKFSFWSSRGIKGPKPWPLFGTNIYYMFGNKLEIDRKWREQYGHTYGLYEGYTPLLRTTDNQVIKHVYVKQFNSFADRYKRFIYGDVQNNWILWSEGSRWSNQRTLVTPMFSSAKMRLMFNNMCQSVDSFINQVQDRLSQTSVSSQSNLEKDKEVAVNRVATFTKNDLSSLTFDILASCFFSLKLNTYQNDQDEFMKRGYEVAKIDWYWMLIWLLTPRQIAKYLELNLVRTSRLECFEKSSMQIIKERRRDNSGIKKQDIIQAFLDAKVPESYEKVFSAEDDREAHYDDQTDHTELESRQREQTKRATLFKTFTDIEIRGQMTFLFIAGFETTASSLSFCVYELAHQQKVQEQILEEIQTKFGREQIRLGTYDFSTSNYSDLLDLKLLDAFISEVLRLYNPFVEFNRVVTKAEGVELPISDSQTIFLPRGTPISTNAYIMQRDEDYYERPNEFDVTRFMPENRDKIKTCTFMPFGLGPRSCTGMRFALLEIKLALVKMISRYVITPGTNNQEYPPKYAPNLIFLQFERTEFNLTPRQYA